ncbi:hypothetical protein [Geodermatophilus sp. SYSU D00815]
MPRTTPLRLLAGGSMAALIAATAACSASSASESDTTSEAAGTSRAATDLDAFCTGVVAFDAVPPPQGGGPEGPDTAAVTAYGEQVADPIAAILENAPESAVDAATTLSHVGHALLEGDAAAFATPETFAALGTVEQAVAENCGFTTVAVDGADYSFEGVPATVPAGVTNFLLSNVTTHGEEHVAIVLRSPDGDPVTPEEFMADPEAAFTTMQPLGTAVASPDGGVGGTTLDLAAGHYLLVCPVAMDENAPPHFMLGMVSEFTVA